MDVKLVVIRTFGNSFDANLAHAKLRDEGIDSVIHNDEKVLIVPSILSETSIRLLVREEDAKRATVIMEKMVANEA